MKKLTMYALLFLGTACTNTARKNPAKTGLNPQADLQTSMDVKARIPDGMLPEIQTFEIDPAIASVVKIGNGGTKLHIPANAFVDQAGENVTSKVKIKFQEFKNSAEMAFSEIPMDLKMNGKDLRFNSSGMFSIQGESKGKEVEIASGKNLKIDYRLAQKNPDTDFYRLKADSSNWELVSEIAENKVEPKMAREKVLLSSNGVQAASDTSFQVSFKTVEPEFRTVEKRVRENQKANQWANQDPFAVNAKAVPAIQNVNQNPATLLGDGFSTDPGHTYPDVIKGLNIASFGVYNCDQVYRLQNVTTVFAKYTDENGKPITDGQVLSMIDLGYNGAFSFNPSSFTCNSKGKNVLLLFTRSSKIFLLEKGEMEKMKIQANGSYEFSMKDVTQKFKTSKDIATYLGIKM